MEVVVVLLILFSFGSFLYGVGLSIFSRAKRRRGLRTVGLGFVSFILAVALIDEVTPPDGPKRTASAEAGVVTDMSSDAISAQPPRAAVSPSTLAVYSASEVALGTYNHVRTAVRPQARPVAIIEAVAALNRQEQAEAAAKLAAEAKAAAEKARLMSGEHCFSPWDGSHILLTKLLKDSLRNPRSYEHIETRFGKSRKNKDLFDVTMTYRAQNGFGGLNIETLRATFEPITCLPTDIQEPR